MNLLPTSIAEAIYSLRQCQFTLNPNEALEYLETQLSIYSLLALYQHYFPSEWTASQAAFYPSIEKPDCHSPRELEFITLIYTHFFPLSYWAMETAYEERLYCIPVTPMGIDWTADEGIENLRDGWKLLLPFSHNGRHWLDEIELAGCEWFDSEFETYGLGYSDIDHPNKIDQKRLRRLCHQLDTPLKFLPLAIKLLDHETRNIWLDQYADDYNYEIGFTSLLWSKASVNFLSRKWQQASRMLDCATKLIDWLEADLKLHAQLLLQIWKQAMQSN